MKSRSIITIILLVLVFFSCSKDEIDTYGDTNYIFFEKIGEDGEYPVQDFTFVFENETIMEKIVEIPVTYTGRFYGTDRDFSIEVVDSLTTATEGVHFVIENKDGQKIEKNTEGGNALIKVLRTEDMTEDVFQIGIRLVENNAFKIGQNNTILLNISDLFNEPDWWPVQNGFSSNLGSFTVVKATLWLKFMGVTDGSDPWAVEPYGYTNEYGSISPVEAERKSSVVSFINWLSESEGAPYYDENGTLVLLTI